MNWDSISFDWNHVRAFLAVVEEGSLSGAARVLNQTQPTLSRQISQLEDALKVSLFTRGTREMQLTQPGTALIEHVREMADTAAQISRVATGQSQEIAGAVRITSTDGMATYVLPSCLKSLRSAYPEITAELVLSNEQSDLTRREADIAIRHERPTQAELVGKLIGETDISLFASEEYLRSHGDPAEVSQLSNASFIGFEHPERLVDQVRSFGIDVSKDNFQVTSSSGVAFFELAKMGLGIAILPTIIAESRLGLKKVLPELPMQKLPIWLVAHKEVQTNIRIRITFDHLSNEIRSLLKSSGK